MNTTVVRRITFYCAAFLILIAAFRIFSLVLQNPMLGYANSYDMIRLQACHQIWPDYRGVGIDVRQGTPAAPLRRYTLSIHVDTVCFPSSEMLFTSIGIRVAKLKNMVTGEKLVSLKTIGFTKALFLVMTMVLAAAYFQWRRLTFAALSHALAASVVLSDPGITLYMNTFYTEFSAVYFAYLTLLGLVIITTSPQNPVLLLLLLIGIVGLGLSKPQHMPLAIFLAVATSTWLLLQHRTKTAVAAAIIALIPVMLQMSGHFSARNDNMRQVNKVDTLGAVLAAEEEPEQFLEQLGLTGDDCLKLRGKNWYSLSARASTLCPQLGSVSHEKIALATITNPKLLVRLIESTIPYLQFWVFSTYGQVEGGNFESVSTYQATIDSLLSRLSKFWFVVFWLLPSVVIAGILVTHLLLKRIPSSYICFGLLLVAIQWLCYLTAVIGDGKIDLAKHAHLGLAALLVSYLLAATALITAKINFTTPGCDP